MKFHTDLFVNLIFNIDQIWLPLVKIMNIMKSISINNFFMDVECGLMV
jgi:hypothetical protein